MPDQIKLIIKGPDKDIYRIIPEQITSSVDFLDADSNGVHIRNVIINTDNVVGDTAMVTYEPDPGSVKLFLSRIVKEDIQ